MFRSTSPLAALSLRLETLSLKTLRTSSVAQTRAPAAAMSFARAAAASHFSKMVIAIRHTSPIHGTIAPAFSKAMASARPFFRAAAASASALSMGSFVSGFVVTHTYGCRRQRTAAMTTQRRIAQSARTTKTTNEPLLSPFLLPTSCAGGVGAPVGKKDGASVDGQLVGIVDGCGVGQRVGSEDGASVDGHCDGHCDGKADGSRVGALVGRGIG
mmetsp:Transcript_4015/g.12332  ORF Transcript_4015/g.12332 Transcript_4015/m.12332 type:complete len:214 (+) Transcript_4015:1717-2358(+)